MSAAGGAPAAQSSRSGHAATEAAHPAPQRHALAAWRLLAGMFGAPLAWLAQMSLSEPLAAQSCYPHVRPLPMPQLPAWLPPLQVILALVSAAALVTALACGLLAWSAMRQTHAQSEGSAGATVEHGGGRAGFLATLAFMTSLMFIAAIVITGLAVVLVSPCSRW